MTDLFTVALELQKVCHDRNWLFCIIGGLAVQHWGEPRFTKDVDMTLLTGFGGEEEYVDTLLGIYGSRIEEAKEFALQNRVLLLQSPGGIGIDIALGALSFEHSVIARAQDIEVMEAKTLRLCSAEDLIVMKAFADRPQDHIDLHGILVRQGTDRLNWNYIWKYLAPLAEAKEAPEILVSLENLYRKIQATEPS